MVRMDLAPQHIKSTFNEGLHQVSGLQVESRVEDHNQAVFAINLNGKTEGRLHRNMLITARSALIQVLVPNRLVGPGNTRR